MADAVRGVSPAFGMPAIAAPTATAAPAATTTQSGQLLTVGTGGARARSDSTNSRGRSNTLYSGTVVVRIMSARRLKAADQNGRSDPYCVVKFGAQSERTKTVMYTLNPTWDEKKEFISRPGPLVPLIFEVWDEDRVGNDDFLGAVIVPIAHYVPGRPVFSRMNLGGLKTHLNHPEHRNVSGELRFQITVNRDPVEWLAMTRQFHELVTGLGWAYPRTFANQASTAATEDDTRLIVDELPGRGETGGGRPAAAAEHLEFQVPQTIAVLAGQAVQGTLYVTTFRLLFFSDTWVGRKQKEMHADTASIDSVDDVGQALSATSFPAAAGPATADSIGSESAAALIADWEGKVVRARWILDATVVPDAAHCIVVPLNSLNVVETGQEASPTGSRELVPFIRLRRAQFHPVTLLFTNERDPHYRLVLEQRLHFCCANAAKLVPAFRLLHDYSLLRQVKAARDRSASRKEQAGEAGGSDGAPAVAAPAAATDEDQDTQTMPLPVYAVGRLPYSDPWMDDNPTPSPSENGDAPKRTAFSLAGLIYSSAASYFGGTGTTTTAGGGGLVATPSVEFKPNPMVIDSTDYHDDVSVIEAETTESDVAANQAALSSALAASIAANGDSGLDAEFELIAPVTENDAARLLATGIVPAQADIDLTSEWDRLGLDENGWRVSSVNEQYNMCSTYPTRLAVPASFTDDMLREVAEFRSKRRIPVAVWRHGIGGNVLARSSQPNVGLVGNMSKIDQALVEAIRMNTPKHSSLTIFDARSRLAAQGNRLRGHGTEATAAAGGYKNCPLIFLNIPNIHDMRTSYDRLREICETPESVDNQWLMALQSTKWLEYIRLLMASALSVAYHLEELRLSVLVHCSDGWDRTAQITGLAQLLLDPYYRSIAGFQVLVDKEWLAFGHKFHDRLGDPEAADQRSPIFLQFLDCIWQLIEQFPTAFEFNELYLIRLWDAICARTFGTFLYNSELERLQNNVQARTLCLWTYLSALGAEVRNPNYRPLTAPTKADPHDTSAHVLSPVCSARVMQFWVGMYLRHDQIFKPLFEDDITDLMVQEPQAAGLSAATSTSNVASASSTPAGGVSSAASTVTAAATPATDAQDLASEPVLVAAASKSSGVLWMPDNSARNCYSCRKAFSVLVRRHHCRSCGRIFCSACLNAKIAMPHLGYPNPEKACASCVTALTQARPDLPPRPSEPSTPPVPSTKTPVAASTATNS